MDSLIDLILEQQAILISLGVVGLVILLAVLIVLGSQFSKLTAKFKAAAELRAQKRRVEAEMRQAEAARRAAQAHVKNMARASKRILLEEAANEEAVVAAQTMDAAIDAAAMLAAAFAAPEDAQAAEQPAEGGVQGDAQAVSGDAASGTTPATTEETPQTPTAMKDLLTSVFVDEDAQERFDNLLRGFDPVDITKLEALSQQVAAQLRSALPAASGS